MYRWATSEMAPIALQACERAGVAVQDIAVFVPHQANLRIVDTPSPVAGRRCPRRTVVARRRRSTSGNTSAASHPARPLAHGSAARARCTTGATSRCTLGFGSGLDLGWFRSSLVSLATAHQTAQNP